FSGLSSILLHNISVTAPGKDTLLAIASAEATIKVLPLLIGNIRIDEVYIDSTTVRIFKSTQRDNISFLLKSRKKKEDDASKQAQSKIDI
ncbi:MAG: hypothetical protein ACK5QU_12510, partial [Bacteroidota bacterium]